MNDKKYFPAVEETNHEGLVRISAAVRLVSIQSVRLRQKYTSNLKTEEKVNPYLLHLPLLHAMAKFPGNITFSLNMLTFPVPAYPLSGKVEMAIVITASGTDHQEVVSDLFGRYASFFSLLSSFLPYAEFEVVKDEAELQKWLHPFRPVSVFSIDRYRDSFSLTVDPKSKKEKNIGFLSANGKNNETPVIKYLFPWSQDGRTDLATIIEALLFCPSSIWFQVRLGPSLISPEEIAILKESLSLCEELINGIQSNLSVLSVQTQGLRSSISERLWQQNRPAFIGGCFLCSDSELDEALVSAVAGQISPAPIMQGQHNIPLKGGSDIQPLAVLDFLNPDCFSPLSILTADEAACVFRIPYAEKQDPPGLPVKSYRTGLAATCLFQENTKEMLFIGNNRHRGHINPIHVTNDDRMRHTFVLGMTGTGKSTYMESMCLRDIYQGRGCCFIDPHGDSVEKILQFYPIERRGDLVLMDFLDRSRVVPFNLLVWQDEEERDRIIDDLYGWLEITYDMRMAGGPMFEQYFRSFFRLLMGEEPRSDFQPMISDFIRLFVDRRFRDYCLKQCHDPQVLRMMHQASEAGGEAKLENMAPYITSKLNRFELDKGLQIMTGQNSMALNVHEVMNKGKVLLVNLGRGRFGETTSGLLASQIVSRFQGAAMKRIDMKAATRRDFFLFCDEFETVASEPFISMLAESRKYRLGLILANQYADQLERRKITSGDSVLKAILGNVGNITCFRLGINDAMTMASVFQPEFNNEDLVNLPTGNCYVNLKTSRCNPSSFSLETKYFQAKDRPDHVQKLRDASNAKYTIPVEQAKRNLEKHNSQIETLCER
jgi:hypothetical protein